MSREAGPPWAPTRVAACVVALVALAAHGQDKGGGAADAVAFIRVIGDFRAEYKRIWKLPIERREIEIATGSGFVIAPGGLVVTNHHVIAGRSEVRPIEGEPAEVTMEVTRIEAVVGTGETRRTLPASVLASDPELDLALLSVTTADLPHVPFGDSDAVDPGQSARVLGFPHGQRVEVARPRGPGVVPGVTVSAGRVGAARGDAAGATRYLQTDASVQPGSSGGPLLDDEGYALGVVRSKLARAEGAGFAIPINVVKDFLEANGLLAQLPARRLRLSLPQSFDWKGLRMALPDAVLDESRSRLRLAGGTLAEDGALLVDRVASALSLSEIEQALLSGAIDGVALTPRADGAMRPGAARSAPARFGSATGALGPLPLRVEYGLFDLGKEKLLARVLAPPDQIAFNLSVVRGALRSLEAERLLTSELRTPLPLDLQVATLRDPRAPAVPVPARFVTDETPGAACRGLRAPDSVLSASPPGDFTVAFRVGFWAQPDAAAAQAAAACALETESVRLGLVLTLLATVVRADDGMLVFTAEAPREKWPLVEPLARVWIEKAR